MIRMQRQRGLPEPEFAVVGGQFRVTLRMATADVTGTGTSRA
jgi:hypothetical protein